MKVDTAALKASVDLLALIGRDVVLRKVATTRGGEYAGPCPFCRGTDRLRVQPERGLWWCRQCSGDRWQDAIAYVMRRDHVSFLEAIALLSDSHTPTMATQRAPAPPPDPEQSAQWRKSAESIAAECATALWADRGAKAREYLNGRGLSDETLNHWVIGYNPRARLVAGLWVEQGITIPWRADSELWHVNVRRPAGEPKYKAVAGGHPYLFGADLVTEHRDLGLSTGDLNDPDALPLGDCVVLVEGEFDCMLLHSLAGDLARVATLGSASKHPSARAVRVLMRFTRILVAYDADDAGTKGANSLSALSARVRVCEGLPDGLDVTDFWRQGGDLRGWLAYNIALHSSCVPHDGEAGAE